MPPQRVDGYDIVPMRSEDQSGHGDGAAGNDFGATGFQDEGRLGRGMARIGFSAPSDSEDKGGRGRSVAGNDFDPVRFQG